MPIDQAIWRIGPTPQRLPCVSLASEKEIEDLIARDVSILDERWMLIGRQVTTDFGSIVDLLAVDADGSLIVIELKRDRTPREVVAQAIDYASWVQGLKSDRIAAIFQRFGRDYRPDLVGLSLDAAFKQRFKSELSEDNLNQAHQIVVVAARLDDSTERIVRYLSERGIGINVVFFSVLGDGDARYLSRAWFLDPSVASESPQETGGDRQPWNGDYYVGFGHSERGRRWEDALRFGFVSAGGGKWYTKTLKLLEPDARIFVLAPGYGYVGVGVVLDRAVRGSEFLVRGQDGDEVPLTRVQDLAGYYGFDRDDEEKTEYFVRVKWLKTVEIDRAVKEVGLFGNQNTVCKPTVPKWTHTVRRLCALFGVS